MQIPMTWKQIDKHVMLCAKYEEPSQLDTMNYLLVREEEGDPFPRWYGNGAKREYVIVMPNGEHYYHDDYLLVDMGQWIRGFYPKERRGEKE